MKHTITQLNDKIEAIETQARKNYAIQDNAKKALFASIYRENCAVGYFGLVGDTLREEAAFLAACDLGESNLNANYKLYFNTSFDESKTTVEVSAYSWRIEQGQGDYNPYLNTIIDGANIAKFIENNLEEIQTMLSTCVADVDEIDVDYKRYLETRINELEEAETAAWEFQKLEYLKEGVEFDQAIRVEFKADWRPSVKAVKVVKETAKTFTVDYVCRNGYEETESRVNQSNVLHGVFGWDYVDADNQWEQAVS